jgi:hypothetical protein
MNFRSFLRRSLMAGSLAGIGSIALLGAQVTQANGPRAFDELRTTPPGSATRALQIRLRWITQEPVANPAHTRSLFEVISIQRFATRSGAPRTSEVGPETLVVVGEDLDGRELSWRIIVDPRVVRSESSSARALGGGRLVYLQTELLFVLPDVSGTARIRVYKPRSESGRVVLDALGAAVIG